MAVISILSGAFEAANAVRPRVTNSAFANVQNWYAIILFVSFTVALAVRAFADARRSVHQRREKERRKLARLPVEPVDCSLEAWQLAKTWGPDFEVFARKCFVYLQGAVASTVAISIIALIWHASHTDSGPRWVKDSEWWWAGHSMIVSTLALAPFCIISLFYPLHSTKIKQKFMTLIINVFSFFFFFASRTISLAAFTFTCSCASRSCAARRRLHSLTWRLG